MLEQREWTHTESPNGVPSASAYRLGCRCSDCHTEYWNYIRDYRSTSNVLRENGDGTTYYHCHKGQPSATTARKWGCIHPRCLNLAGLYLDPEGTVKNRVTDAIEEDFGTPVKPVPHTVP